MDESYNENSGPQLAAVHSTVDYIREATHVLDIQVTGLPLIIADFGSAHGNNSMCAVKNIMICLKETKKVRDENDVLVVHNDLPNNSWTTLFQLLNEDRSYYSVASGRSFYEACLPPNSLAFGYSSTSLHWLSRKPCNLSNHCSSLFARGNELKAFQEQAYHDWMSFLKYRSKELIPGGVLLLLIPCVNDTGSNGFDLIREILYQCAKATLTSQELLDYTLPIYARSYSECLDHALFKKYSLEVIRSDFKSVKMPFTNESHHEEITSYVRSWSEPILKNTLLTNNRSEVEVQNVLDQFWALYNQEIRKNVDHLRESHMNYTYLILQKSKNK